MNTSYRNRSEDEDLILHPVLRTALDYIPIKRPERLLRLHPAIASADLRSRYLSDPEVNIPRPLFSSRNSRVSSTGVNSAKERHAEEPASSDSETETEISLQTSTASTPSTLADTVMKEIDAEISAQIDAQILQDWYIHDITAAARTSRTDYDDHEELEPEFSNTQTRIIDLRAELEAEDVQLELRKKVGNLQSPKYRMVKISSSNLRALAVAEAFARVQTFKASTDYLDYQEDQELIFNSPQRHNLAAKERVAEFKETPLWTRYAADLALILEHGDTEDVENITDCDSRRASSMAPSSPIVREVSQPRLRRVGPWAQTWSSLGKTMEKAEMWD